jgi:hypothetical protein
MTLGTGLPGGQMPLYGVGECEVWVHRKLIEMYLLHLTMSQGTSVGYWLKELGFDPVRHRDLGRVLLYIWSKDMGVV